MRWLAPLLALMACVAMAADFPTSTPTTTHAASRPAVTLEYSIYLARREVITKIAPDGTIEQRRTDNKRYGDAEGTWTPTYVTRRGSLTAEQLRELSSLLNDVAALPGDRFATAPDEGAIRLKIGERTIEGGASRQPPAVAALRQRVEAWANALPIVAP